MIIVGFYFSNTLAYFVTGEEFKKTQENDRSIVLVPEKPYFTNVTLHGQKNVEADLLTIKQKIPIQITLTSGDGASILNTTIIDSHPAKFNNTKPAGIYQLKISNLGNKSANLTVSIYDTCWVERNDFTGCELHRYYDLVVLIELLAVIGYVGIAVLVLGGLLFFIDRRKTLYDSQR